MVIPFVNIRDENRIDHFEKLDHMTKNLLSLSKRQWCCSGREREEFDLYLNSADNTRNGFFFGFSNLFSATRLVCIRNKSHLCKQKKDSFLPFNSINMCEFPWRNSLSEMTMSLLTILISKIFTFVKAKFFLRTSSMWNIWLLVMVLVDQLRHRCSQIDQVILILVFSRYSSMNMPKFIFLEYSLVFLFFFSLLSRFLLLSFHSLFFLLTVLIVNLYIHLMSWHNRRENFSSYFYSNLNTYV